MNFYKQEHLYISGETPQRGSCHPTVLACVMNLKLHEVPYFHLFYLTYQEIQNLEKFYSKKYLEGKPIDECKEYQQDNYYNALHRAKTLWIDIHDIFINSRGYELLDITDIDQWLVENPDTPYFAYGMSSRKIGHIVIYKDGVLYHDPHPSNEGLSSLDEKLPFKFLKKI